VAAAACARRRARAAAPARRCRGRVFAGPRGNVAVSGIVLGPQLGVAGIIALAVGLALLRMVRRGGYGLALWLQVPAAALLYLALCPPNLKLRADALTVMTVGATAAQRSAAPAGQPIVALPGAAAPADAEFTPDLATALRRHPAVRRLTVIGGGLEARDREAVADRALTFQPAPEQGLVELQAPARVPLGRQWSLSGRTAAPIRRVELRDPSGSVADAVEVDTAGRFVLSATARGAGAARFELRLLGAGPAVIDTVSIPVIVESGESLAVILRYGAVNPELKYWRRWAVDAGLRSSVSAGVTEGVSLREGDAGLTPAALAQTDLVIVDARGWAGLSAAEKSALRAAIADGLGLLLRADGALSAQTAADWRELGFDVTATAAPGSVTLDRRFGQRERSAFSVAPVAVDAVASRVQLQADDGTPLAWWRAQGQGRVGLWRLVDSYRLILLGEPERYADLWAGTLEVLARPRAPVPPEPRLPENAWVFERVILCGLGAAASVRAPGGEPVALTVNAETCAGYWPAAAGWHVLQTGAASWPFYVRATDDGGSFRTALAARATTAMMSGDAGPQATAAGRDTAKGRDTAAPPALRAPMARWPWFLAWLGASAVIWWQERRRNLRAEGHFRR